MVALALKTLEIASRLDVSERSDFHTLTESNTMDSKL